MSIISSASGSVLITSGSLDSNYSGSITYGPKQILDGLILYADAANPLSYPGSGNVWNNLVYRSGSTNNEEAYNGELSGSAAVVPSWDSTHQGRIHVKASSSYPDPEGSASSSYVSFGTLGKPSPLTGTNPQFSFNTWFEIDYSKQIIEYSIVEPPVPPGNWYSQDGGNSVTIFSKWAGNDLLTPSGFIGRITFTTGANSREFLLQLSTLLGDSTPPNPITNPYYFRFTIVETPSGDRGVTLKNLNYLIPDKKPTNIHINYNGGAIPNSRIELYINGYRTSGDQIEITGSPNGIHSGGTSRLALGAQIGNTLAAQLEGVTEGSGRSSMMQADAYYYLFQIYNRILTPQEVEQNYFAHRYRFRPWEIL
jgi:hypothetical protein